MKSKRLPFLIIGLAIITLFILMAIFPTMFTSYNRKMSFDAWLEPSSIHLFGTNSLGYDTFTELVYGTRDTLLIGLSSSVISLVLGFVIGILATKKGVVGTIFDGLINIFIMLPRLIVLIVLASFFRGSKISLILLISIFTWVGTAREVRAKVIHIYKEPYIEACKLYGYSKFHTAIYHVLPNLKDILISRFLIGITTCILMESTLAFLGFGDIYYPSWGVMINIARNKGALLRGAYALLLAPSLSISLVSLSFYFMSVYFEARHDTIVDE